MHSHECRDCYRDIECDGIDGRNGCSAWNGSNDGCECAPHDPEGCRDPYYGYRCADCYPAKPQRRRRAARRY